MSLWLWLVALLMSVQSLAQTSAHPNVVLIIADAGRSPTMDALRRLHKEGKLTAHQARIFQKPRPAKELYVVVADPQEVNNLANDPRHAKALTELRARLKTWGSETNDVSPARRTPDEFDRETGQPFPNRQRPRPSKLEINRVTKED
jgi:hypothetical protein